MSRPVLRGLVLDGAPKPNHWWRMTILLLGLFSISSSAAIIVAQHSQAPVMLKVIFWILLLLWAIGSFGWRDNPNVVRGTGLVMAILFGILGYYTLGF